MPESQNPIAKGRGAGSNPGNRFESHHFAYDLQDVADDEEYLASLGRPRTEFLPDRTRAIVVDNTSSDVGFESSVNPYRGCEHGCIYCYARPTHEYLGFSAGLDFETKILVKHDAPELLANELSSPKWRPRPLAMSGVTDPYQPAERELRLTRRCLEVMVEFRQAVSIITKNRLVTRDLDLLGRLAGWNATGVFLSVTTLDADLARKLEPRTSPPARRLEAIRALADAGIPTGVMAAPVIPGLTDHELPAILEAAAKAGASHAGYTTLRLPLGVAPLFDEWLDRHEPGRKEKILTRIRSIRGGRLNDSRFKVRMRGEGPFADLLSALFKKTCRRLGLNQTPWPVSASAFRVPERVGATTQLRLFE